MTTLNFIPKEARLCNNTYIVNVPPELARQWLSINNFNRPKNTESVAKYVRQIRDGHWRLTHQGVALTQNGFLLDGQHRLFALIECGVTLPMRVCFNEPIENYEVSDCQSARQSYCNGITWTFLFIIDQRWRTSESCGDWCVCSLPRYWVTAEKIRNGKSTGVVS